MVKQRKAEQQKSLRFTNLLLMLLFTTGSLWLADLAFRHYERLQLVPRMPQINGSGPINLSALLYNDSLVDRRSGDGEFRIQDCGEAVPE